MSSACHATSSHPRAPTEHSIGGGKEARMWVQIGLVGLLGVVFLVRLVVVLRHDREPRGVTKPDS
ncbi:hypothetical protein GCM10027445_39790 [Amycolatopsis endophytica]